ncbi:MAG: polymerase ECF-type sigma factor [Verrucomicrobiales bacterium]|nr:polymerase ECF-type sigma factor [Verrucomicrobiales bacterium]
MQSETPNQIATDPAALEWPSPEFGAIYDENAKEVYYLCLRMLGDPAFAEDATHDVFIKAFKKWAEFRGASSVRTWLYRIAINHCKNLVQTWHHRHIITTDDEVVWQGCSHDSTPLEILEAKELGQRIHQALDALPEEYRLLLLLVADEKLSYDEVGALTDQSADAVRGKLHRARKAFATQFQKLS